MKYVIPKGWKSALPFFFWFWKKEKTISYRVRFTASCRYVLPQEEKMPEEQRDINKLFGFGYWDWKALLKFKKPHHVDSARIGWRYSKSRDECELLAYVYRNKLKTWVSLGFCVIELDYPVSIIEKRIGPLYSVGAYGEMFSGEYRFEFNNRPAGPVLPFDHEKRWKYRLNPRFGGDHAAPHPISLFLRKLKTTNMKRLSALAVALCLLACNNNAESLEDLQNVDKSWNKKKITNVVADSSEYKKTFLQGLGQMGEMPPDIN